MKIDRRKQNQASGDDLVDCTSRRVRTSNKFGCVGINLSRDFDFNPYPANMENMASS